MSHIPPFDFAGLPRISGHRGAKGTAPENTLSSIQRAEEIGVTFIEFDVNLTADDIVVFHDYTLDRCTNGTGVLVETPYSTLSRLDAGSHFSLQYEGERVPRLVDVIEELSGLNIGANVEIKSQAGFEKLTVERVAAAVLKNWPAKLPILLSSFNENVMLLLALELPELTRGWLVEEIPEDWQEKLVLFGASSLHCNSDYLTRDQAENVIEAGYPILVYTVNERERAKELLDWGVNSVISDHPERMMDLQVI